MKIYLDMDGVIADFFGGLQKYYGVDHWKNLPDKVKNKIPPNSGIPKDQCAPTVPGIIIL